MTFLDGNTGIYAVRSHKNATKVNMNVVLKEGWVSHKGGRKHALGIYLNEIGHKCGVTLKKGVCGRGAFDCASIPARSRH